MGGKVFDDVRPVSLDVLNDVWPNLITLLHTSGWDRIVPVGTTWKKDVMGDIDVAGSTSLTMGVLCTIARDVFGDENTKRHGRVVSLRHTLINGDKAQVDVFTGDVEYISWSRYGPGKRVLGDDGTSVVKGFIRNVFLNYLLRTLTTVGSTHVRDRLALDFDKALMCIRQTHVGVTGRQLKDWKTVDARVVTCVPDEIVEMMFRTGAATDTLTFEGCVKLLKRSYLSDRVTDIMQGFARELESMSSRERALFTECYIDPILLSRSIASDHTYVDRL